MKLWINRASHNGYVCPGASVFRAFAGCHNVTHMPLRKIRYIRMPKQSWSTVWPYHRLMVSNHHSPPLNCLFWFRPSCKSHWVVNWPHASTSALSWFSPQSPVLSSFSQVTAPFMKCNYHACGQRQWYHNIYNILIRFAFSNHSASASVVHWLNFWYFTNWVKLTLH